jgi:hypothetical protein
MEDRVESTSHDSRAPPRHQFGQAKKQIAPPTNLLTEKDNRENDRC